MNGTLYYDEMDCLNIRDLDRAAVAQIAESGGVIYWCYRGLWGKIRNATLRDVVRTLGDWDRLLTQKGAVVTAPAAPYIAFDQTSIIPHPPESAVESAPLLQHHRRTRLQSEPR